MQTPIEQHYQDVIEAASTVGAQSLANPASIGELHQFVEDLRIWINAVGPERELIQSACREFETSALLCVLGLYRQAFASLRLGLELVFGACHFASHRIQFEEWRSNRADIRWSEVMGDPLGVFSSRQVDAFFPSLAEQCETLQERSRRVYRQLSEFVHGNAHTWQSVSTLRFDTEAAQLWSRSQAEIAELCEIALLVRYLHDHLSELQPSFGNGIGERTNHIAAIRERTAANWNNDHG